jgi:uncharacterized protein (DUF1499 family)
MKRGSMLTPLAAWHLLLPAVLLIGCSGTRPAGLGAQDGKLLPCPSSPNCVSSQAPDEGHRTAPLPYTGPARDAWSRLTGIIASLPRAKVMTDSDTYLHVEFRSLVFRFVDDVEFLADDDAKVIHVRSASRVGHSDLGANRRRIETIRARWLTSAAAP